MKDRDRKRRQFQEALRKKETAAQMNGAQLLGGAGGPIQIIPQYHGGPLMHPHVVSAQRGSQITVDQIGGQSRLENATLQIVAAVIAKNGALADAVLDDDPEVAQDATNRLVIRAANIARASIWASSAEVQQRIDAEASADAQADKLAADDMVDGVEALPAETEKTDDD